MKHFGKISLLDNQVLELFESDNTSKVSLKGPASLAGDFTIVLPGADGSNGQVLSTDGSGNLSFVTRVTGPGSATDNALARFDGTTGALIQNSSASLDDSGNLSVAGTIATAAASNQLVFELGANDVTISVSAPAAARTITLPDPGASADFVLTKGAQTLDDVKTFSSAPLLKAALDLEDPGAGTNKITIQAPTLAGSYTLTLPVDDGTGGQVLTTDGAGVLTWETPSTGLSKAASDWVTGDGATFVYAHNLGTTDVQVQVFDLSDDAKIEVDSVVITDANTVTLTASSAPGASGFRVVVVG